MRMKDKLIASLAIITTIAFVSSIIYGFALVGEPQSLWLMQSLGIL